MPRYLNIIISLHPRWADKIIAGTKTVEIRKQNLLNVCGAQAFLYSTKPVGAIIGRAHIYHTNIVQGLNDPNFERVRKCAQIEYQEMMEYTEYYGVFHYASLRSVVQFKSKVYPHLLDIRVPQSYASLTQEQADAINKAGGMA